MYKNSAAQIELNGIWHLGIPFMNEFRQIKKKPSLIKSNLKCTLSDIFIHIHNNLNQNNKSREQFTSIYIIYILIIICRESYILVRSVSKELVQLAEVYLHVYIDFPPPPKKKKIINKSDFPAASIAFKIVNQSEYYVLGL